MNEANQRWVYQGAIAAEGSFLSRICRLLRNEKLIRNGFRNEISCDWRSLSRMCGFSPIF